MKKLFYVLLVILLALALCACAKSGTVEPEPDNEPDPIPDNGNDDDSLNIYTSYDNIAAYEKYLERVSDDKANLNYSYWYDEENGNYKCWLDNDSEEYFSRAYIAVFDSADSQDALFDSQDYYLIRPLDYLKFAEQPFDSEPGYYDLWSAETYALNFEKDLKYEFYYSVDDDYGYVISASYDGELNDDLAMKIAKKEYVIAVLTSLYEDNVFMFNKSDLVLDGYDPILSGASYRAYLDFNAKTITLYKGDSVVGNETMD
ncbi:MAG: hypothetical protein IJF95_07700 [Erysipelotrichaceae bacterium]|nr:hypothetical protein [Erysipelotrichaceae bacterium]